MTTAGDISAVQTLAQTRAVTAPHATQNAGAAKKAASQFESVFISQFLGSMFEGISTDGPFGGGQGEQMFRSLMLDEYGKQIETQGGLGLSAAITRQLLHAQETGKGLAGK
jgi:Rod binding domain-containing protein